MIYLFLILVTLCKADKQFGAQLQCEMYDSMYGYWECQTEDCSEQNKIMNLKTFFTNSTMNFTILNEQLEIIIIGSIESNIQVYKNLSFEECILNLYENNILEYIFQLINTNNDDNVQNQNLMEDWNDDENKYNPADYVSVNILYCSISSLLLVFSLTTTSIFILHSKRLDQKEIQGIPLYISISGIYIIFAIFVIACSFSDGYRSYFILPMILFGFNILFSFSLIQNSFEFFENGKHLFCLDIIVSIIYGTFQFIISILTICFLTEQFDKSSFQFSIYQPFYMQTFYILQLIPLFEQIRSTLQNAFNNIEGYQENQAFFYLYLCFISLPAIFCINFQSYYYKVFQFEPDFTLLIVYLVLFIVFVIIIILQHIYGPLFKKLKCACDFLKWKKRKVDTQQTTIITYKLRIQIYDVIENCIICNKSLYPKEAQQNLLPKQVIETPCNHVFHQDCLTVWKLKYGKCPICNEALPPMLLLIE